MKSFKEFFAENFKDGKKKGFTSKRDALEHAKRNNLTFGSNDLEEEARHNRKRIDDEYVDATTDKILEDFDKVQRIKKQINANKK